MTLDHLRYRALMAENPYTQDLHLQSLLKTQLSPEWEPYLQRMGDLVAGELSELAVTANTFTPRLIPRTPWGDRADRIEVHPSYDRMARLAYESGVVWPRFQAKAPWASVFALGYLFSQAEQGLFCPICLTAGSAWMIERFGSPKQKETYLPRLAARRYEDLWEGSMFLTERAGGSDVGAAETVAREEDGVWRIWGDKWFCSNAGRAEVMLVLARPENAPAGTKGLGLFLVKAHLSDTGEGSGVRPNHIQFHRLKDKLGTRSMPSAELSFDGAIAEPVGDIGRGFNQMAEMLNISRIYNAVASVGNMRRVVREVQAYARSRRAFGSLLIDHPQVADQLNQLITQQESATALVFEAIRYLDRSEANPSDRTATQCLRLLTPLIKLSTARQAVDMASAGIELFGGNGYIEDWPLARFWRDAQVLPIWEGTTNILVLDTMRGIQKDGTAAALLDELDRRAKDLPTALQTDLLPAIEAADHHWRTVWEVPDPIRIISFKAWGDRAVSLFQSLLLAEAIADGDPRCEAKLLRHELAQTDWQTQLNQRLTKPSLQNDLWM